MMQRENSDIKYTIMMERENLVSIRVRVRVGISASVRVRMGRESLSEN